MSRRLQRLNTLFQEELAELIQTEIRDPRMAGVVSITRIDTSPDMENADVYISVLGTADDKSGSLAALRHAAPFLRRELLHRVHIRKVPHLHFVLDETIEEAAHVLELMRQVREDEQTTG
jgi:ribosome-binding factor A